MSDQNAALVPGQTILGRYRLKKLLGRGGFGVVWLADDEDLRMEVALKFLSDLIASNPDAVEDLKRETRFSLRLTHPHIVRIYGFFHDGNVAGLSMEHVQGGTLIHIRAARGRRCFDIAELAPWIIQLCDALDYAHQKVHIVHRDLKPANLMIDQHGELKVADFGISRSISDSRTRLTNDRDTSGTLAYMSPQQMLGDSASPLDDVYSLGATLYDLLSGKPPFHTGDIVQQVLHVTPAPLAVRRRDLDVENEAAPVPPDWEATIAACLDKEPRRRPQSAGEVAERLGLRSPTGGSTRVSPGLSTSDAALLETRPIDPGMLPASGASGGAPAGGSAGASPLSPASGGASGARSWPASAGSAPLSAPSRGTVVAAGGPVAPSGFSGPRGAAAPALDDSATVIVPATEVAAAGRRAADSGAAVYDPFAEERRRRSKLPLVIGAALVGVVIIGGGIFALTRKSGDGTAASQAAVIPAPTPASGGPPAKDNSSTAENSDADQGLAPPRSETSMPAGGPESRGAGPANRVPESGEAATAAAAGSRIAPDRSAGTDRETAARIARLKRQISRELSRRDWTSARDDARALLILSPADDDARTALSVASARLDEAARASVASATAAGGASNPAPATPPVSPPKPPAETAPPAQATETPHESPPPREPAHETPPPPARPAENEADGIRKTIETYKEALEALDVNRYASIWVSLDADSRRKLSASFADLKSQAVDVNVNGIDVTGETAAARLHESRTVAFKAGNRQTVSRDLTMHFRKEDGRWLIVRLESG